MLLPVAAESRAGTIERDDDSLAQYGGPSERDSQPPGPGLRWQEPRRGRQLQIGAGLAEIGTVALVASVGE